MREATISNTELIIITILLLIVLGCIVFLYVRFKHLRNATKQQAAPATPPPANYANANTNSPSYNYPATPPASNEDDNPNRPAVDNPNDANLGNSNVLPKSATDSLEQLQPSTTDEAATFMPNITPPFGEEQANPFQPEESTDASTSTTNPDSPEQQASNANETSEPQEEEVHDPLHLDARERFGKLAGHYDEVHTNMGEKADEHEAGDHHEPLHAPNIVPGKNSSRHFSSIMYEPEYAPIFANEKGLGHLKKANEIERKMAHAKAAFSTSADHARERHEQKKQAFTQQVLHLGRPYQDIKIQLNNGKIEGREKNWAYRYCSIFDSWLAAEYHQTVENLRNFILLPIKDLNASYPKNPFTPVLGQGVTVAEALYNEIRQNNKKLHSRLQDLRNVYQEAHQFAHGLSQHLGKGQKRQGTTRANGAAANTTQPSVQPDNQGQEQQYATGENEGPIPPMNTNTPLEGSAQTNENPYVPTHPPVGRPTQKNGHPGMLAAGDFLKKYWSRIALFVLPVLAGLYWWIGRPNADAQVSSSPGVSAVDSTQQQPPNSYKTPREHYSHLKAYLDSLHRSTLSDTADQQQANPLLDPMKPRYGIDVSHHQEEIDWEHIKLNNRHIDFAVVKATEGQSAEDPYFKTNWPEAQKHFAVVGAYHFFNNRDPESQADNFIKHVPTGTPNTFFPILDVEPNDTDGIRQLAESGRLISRMEAYINKVEAHYRGRVIIYTGYSFYKDYLQGHFPDNPFWLAHYSKDKNDEVRDLIQKSVQNKEVLNLVVAWQYSSNGIVKGIPKPVDLNYVPEYFWNKVVNDGEGENEQ